MKKIGRKIYRKLLHRIDWKKRNQYYRIDGFEVDLGKTGHALPIAQKENPMYDRFIPFLAEIADVQQKNRGGGWIIDIGANVGDTVTAMLRHTSANILCVEPSRMFFELLIKNINKLENKFRDRIRTANYYIALDSSVKYNSNIKRGTAIMAVTEEKNSEANAISLLNLIEKEEIKASDVAIVKVDTDGFDANCIMSLGGMLKENSPCLYWENQIDTEEQFYGYLDMLDYLGEMGYSEFFIFDNFGNFMCEAPLKVLEDIQEYMWRIQIGKSTRSFYYVDVLASKNDKKLVCRQAVDKYLGSVAPINKN